MGLIRNLDPCYRARVNELLREQWDCPPSVSRGKAIDTTVLPGFAYIEDNELAGAVTYHIEEDECEIVTLISLAEGKGIGGALIDAVLDVAGKNHCKRLCLITTNDNTQAIRFYQAKLKPAA